MKQVQKRETVTLRINLVGYWPEIWRTFRVPVAISLSSLHEIIQVVMGWTDSHLHQFSTEFQRFADPTFDTFGEDDAHDSRTVALMHLVREPGDEIAYKYDLGDGWMHRIVATDFGKQPINEAECLNGERSCPPEDVGGIPGFRDFLLAMADPAHEEYQSLCEWNGGVCDVDDFNMKNVDADLRRCKISTRLRKAKRKALQTSKSRPPHSAPFVSREAKDALPFTRNHFKRSTRNLIW